MENLTPFYDSTTGSGFFNLKQQENPFSDGELRHLLESFSSCLDLQQLIQKYFSELRARVPVNHLSLETPVGRFIAGKELGDKERSNSADDEIKEKAMLTELDDESEVKIRHYYCNTLSMRAQQIIKELNKLIRIPVKNAIAFTELKQVAMKDPLTSLGNRTLYDETLAKLCRQAHRTGENLTLLVLDLDNFKPVNDYYGHCEGDKVLVAFAEALSISLRASDYAFRFGGDEFCCLIQGSGIETNSKVIGRLTNSIKSNVLLKKYDVTCSIGSAALRAKDTPESLFQRADEALYAAKRQGRDCVVNA